MTKMEEIRMPKRPLYSFPVSQSTVTLATAASIVANLFPSIVAQVVPRRCEVDAKSMRSGGLPVWWVICNRHGQVS